jgi:hypothetical protein
MRPVLIAVALVLLVIASLATGVLASDLPFWKRAWRWHAAWPEAPVRLGGAHATLPGAAMPAELPVGDDPRVTAAVTALLDDPATEALLVARDGQLLFEYYGAGIDQATRIDGRELSRLTLVLLYGAARVRGLDARFDLPVGSVLDAWRGDPRGEITVRQLLQGLSGLEPADGPFLDPFGNTARLHSGPNFERAALGFDRAWPAGSNAADNPVDLQLAAAALERIAGRPVHELLREWVVGPLQLDSVRVMLDHHRGRMAAHCCIRARARDWLAMGLVAAQGGEIGGVRVHPPEFSAELTMTSPVAPQRGLGVERVGPSGDGAGTLLAGGGTRSLLIDPSRRSVWLWFRSTPMDAAARAALLTTGIVD